MLKELGDNYRARRFTILHGNGKSSNARSKSGIPSGWAIFCMAVGAIIIGIEILKPRTVVVMSILLTSIRMRGRNLFLKKKKTQVFSDNIYIDSYTSLFI